MRRITTLLLTLFLSLPTVSTAAETYGHLIKRANHGDASAMVKIGNMLSAGLAVPRNLPDAMKWYTKAAEAGNSTAMVKLGDAYLNGIGGLPKSESKARQYYSAAAALNHKGAIKRLQSLDVGSSPTGQNLAPALQEFVKGISKATKEAGVAKLSVVNFRCNGYSSTQIADYVRNKMLESLLRTDLPIYDRAALKLVAEEAGLSFGTETASANDAILVGEIFCRPNAKTGIVAVRMFSAKDGRILYAGFSPVTWSNSEMKNFGSDSRLSSKLGIAFLTPASIQKLKSEISKVKVGFAFRSTGEGESSLDHRCACAQMAAALIDTQCVMYEREMIKTLAEEVSLDGEDVFNRITSSKALGNVSSLPSSGDNQVVLKIQTVPEGRLLLNINLKQQVGGHAGSNADYGN